MSRVRSQSVTVTTIARRVGVAACTVSAVLAGQAKARRIGEETARSILEEARQLNYVPNSLARGLRMQRTGTIGVVLVDFTNSWADRVISGIDEVFDARGCQAFIMTHRWDSAREARQLQTLVERRVDGIIGVPLPQSASTYRALQRRGTPLLFLGDTLERMPRANFVAWDSRPATKAVVEHLLQIGRRRIAMLHQVGEAMIGGRGRHEAYMQALREAGLEPNPQWFAGVTYEREIPEVMARMFSGAASERPDALYANNDGLAFAALAALRQLGLRVPEDVAVAGMGDLPRGDDLGAGLTTAREPCEEVGRLAAESILELVGEPEHRPIQRLVPRVDLKVRRTTQGIAPLKRDGAS